MTISESLEFHHRIVVSKAPLDSGGAILNVIHCLYFLTNLT